MDLKEANCRVEELKKKKKRNKVMERVREKHEHLSAIKMARNREQPRKYMSSN